MLTAEIFQRIHLKKWTRDSWYESEWTEVSSDGIVYLKMTNPYGMIDPKLEEIDLNTFFMKEENIKKASFNESQQRILMDVFRSRANLCFSEGRSAWYISKRISRLTDRHKTFSIKAWDGLVLLLNAHISVKGITSSDILAAYWGDVELSQKLIGDLRSIEYE